MKLTLKPFQVKGVKYLKKQKYVYCADDQGLGKSVQALVAATDLDLPWLVVCPAYLKTNWEAEIEKFKIDTSKLVGIVSYSSLKKNSDLFSKAKIFIADEAHALKTMKAKRTQYFHRFVKDYTPKYLWLLSGTPIKNRVPDLYSPLLLLSRGENNGIDIRRKFKSEYAFCMYFCHKKTMRLNVNGRQVNVPKFEGLKNPEVLKSLLKGKYFRRTKDKVLDLDPIINTYVSFESLDKDKDLEKAWDEFLETGKKDSTAKRKSAILKSSYTAQYVENLIGMDCRPVVFSDHPDAIDEIRNYLESYNINVGVINADVSPEQRGRIVFDFQNGEYSAILATIGTGSTGFTITASSDVVFNDISWTPTDNDQATDRVYRMGQLNKVTRHYMTRGHIDQRIINSVEEKMKAIKEVL